MTHDDPEQVPLQLITDILADSLFGLYTYDLSRHPQLFDTPSRLIILYGHNGSGKTTILRLIYDLLSSHNNQGHRGNIALIPFRTFAITLSSGVTVSANRSANDLVGSYQLSIKQPGQRVQEFPITVDPEGKVLTPTEPYCKAIDHFQLHLHYLADDRQSIAVRDDHRDRERRRLIHEPLYVPSHRGAPRRNDDVLHLAIRRLESWFRSQALRGSSRGEVNTNQIYADIARRIARDQKPEEESAKIAPASLIPRLRELEEHAREFAGYGLISDFDAGPITESLEEGGANARIIAKVILPYIEGIQARLDAMREVQSVASKLISHLNSFLTNKRGCRLVNDNSFFSSATQSSRETSGALSLLTSLNSP